MYNELLSEADSNRALEKNIYQLDDDITKANEMVLKKSKFLMTTKRRFENLEHVSQPLNKKLGHGPPLAEHGQQPDVHPTTDQTPPRPNGQNPKNRKNPHKSPKPISHKNHGRQENPLFRKIILNRAAIHQGGLTAAARFNEQAVVPSNAAQQSARKGKRRGVQLNSSGRQDADQQVQHAPERRPVADVQNRAVQKRGGRAHKRDEEEFWEQTELFEEEQRWERCGWEHEEEQAVAD
jgi:hypothetical protein